MDKHLFTVVLSGGSGTRLWPISRSSYPKQFADFKRTETLFESTIRRVSSLNDYRESIVVCNKSHEGEENFVGDSEIIALGGASNETKDRPLG